eukprot:CAMPEP_0173246428 /NCGR_PEP_ID=MMETSP1142-20121109/17313_1 /TAXON_ID=483371 /ORGANISM="non described non described, Strain CCMP2298" /LENGTH=152 /DNA_ID=CAMNT_0014178653 /DNA_START=421 /DNA_END=876 /DNA_ORIENTATION=+
MVFVGAKEEEDEEEGMEELGLLPQSQSLGTQTRSQSQSIYRSCSLPLLRRRCLFGSLLLRDFVGAVAVAQIPVLMVAWVAAAADGASLPELFSGGGGIHSGLPAALHLTTHPLVCYYLTGLAVCLCLVGVGCAVATRCGSQMSDMAWVQELR